MTGTEEAETEEAGIGEAGTEEVGTGEAETEFQAKISQVKKNRWSKSEHLKLMIVGEKHP